MKRAVVIVAPDDDYLDAVVELLDRANVAYALMGNPSAMTHPATGHLLALVALPEDE